MRRKIFKYNGVLASAVLLLWSCKTPLETVRRENRYTPKSYGLSKDSVNIANVNWRSYFTDKNLITLIDSALENNQELRITLQEIEISKNEIRARKGDYLPFVGVNGGSGMESAARYTRSGAVDHSLNIMPGVAFPDPVNNHSLCVYATWELDVWKKLRNAKKSAVMRYLGTIEGKNFMLTHLVSEIAMSYYELMALDNLLDIVQKNIAIQSSALEIIKQEKDAAKVSQLAVNRFAAQLLNTQNLQYAILQRITETENRLNFLAGRFPQPIQRNSAVFEDLAVDSIRTGIPSQLLENRPDIKRAELELIAARLDLQVARANFYPAFRITAESGFQAFKLSYFVNPESLFLGLAGELAAPVINRNAIKAAFNSANSRQIQAMFDYERTILGAYIDVANELSNIRNLQKSYDTKSQEVTILNQSVGISNSLFKSARADYMEVLLTQREALESRMELIGIKLDQVQAKINIYQALGGGWK